MEKNKYDNDLIVLEGIDGCGKTTTCSQLVQVMNARLQRRINLTMNDREFLARKLLGKLKDEDLEQLLSEMCYGGTILFSSLPIVNPYSKIKREIEKIPCMDLQFFHFLASALFKNEIIQALLPYVSVVVDRYIYSVLAHHHAYGANLAAFNLSEFPILEPDIYILLTCNESERRRRLLNRGGILDEKDQREKTPGSPLQKIEETFVSYGPNIIDTTALPLEEVRSHILKIIADSRGMKIREIESDGAGFDAKKYIDSQRTAFRERLAQAPQDATVFIEFGGKPIDDQHAARVLPGFDPDCKLELLADFDDFSKVMVVNFRDIIRPRIRGDSSLFYESEIRRIIDKFMAKSISVDHVAISLVPDELEPQDAQKLDDLERLMQDEYNIPTSRLGFVPGYPGVSTLDDMESFLAKNKPIFHTNKKHVLVFSPGGGSGKFGLCLGQMARELSNGKNIFYVKYETFPAYGLPADHPVNGAFLAATADLGNSVSSGSTMTTYDKDVENFALLQHLLGRFPGVIAPEHPLLAYREPSDMGINMTHVGIKDSDIVNEAARKEIIRRRLRYVREVELGIESPATLDRVSSISIV